MARILLRKRLDGCLVPTDEYGQQVLRKWKAGTELFAEVKKPRNPKHHRLYFALLNTVFSNQEQYRNFDHFRKAVQIAAGHVEELITLDGEVLLQPKSIAFDALDEIEFTKVFNETMRVCVDHFLQGVDEYELRGEVERYAA